MKKIVRILLCLALIAGMLSLAACGGSDDVTGRYAISAMDMGGTEIDGAMLDASLTAMGIEREDMYIELKADGTGVMSVMGEVAQMEYKDGKIWPVESPDEKVDFEVDGNELTISIQGMSMTFTK